MKIFNFSLFLIAMLSFTLLMAPAVRTDDAADDDEVEEDAVINEDAQNEAADETAQTAETDAEEGSSDENVLSSPYVKTNVLFIEPESSNLPAGRLAKLLVGFQNNGSTGFLVEGIEGSFRYPQDFSYFIQNFSAFEFNKVIDSEREGTFEYFFTPSETFSSRQFGLTINLRYRNAEGRQFVNTVFNETINVVEPDEGLDGETFFLYVFLAAIVVLLGVAAQQFFSVFKKKGRSSKFTSVQKSANGAATSADDVDFAWIPKEHLQQSKSPKTSPRQRKSAKNGGAVSVAGNSSNDDEQ